MKTNIALLLVLTLSFSCSKTDKTDANSKSDSLSSNKIENVATTSDAGKPALNPAHGEPHHRCDIEVGAPIDSAPTQQTDVPQQATPSVFGSQAPAPAASPQASNPLSPKPTINPAHGEPHHRCDLAVGAPLS